VQERETSAGTTTVADVFNIALGVSISWCLTSSIHLPPPFVKRTQNEIVEVCGVVHCVISEMLVRRQIACLVDVQYWHIELFHYFHLPVVKVLYP
jgi:hypothetical protein